MAPVTFSMVGMISGRYPGTWHHVFSKPFKRFFHVIINPCDGTVSMLYPTLHAFAVTSEDGMDILIHIGIDTVKLKGKGFRSFVKQGQKVHVGERIIRVDSYDMKNKGIDLTTMILFPSADKKIAVKKEGYADQGKTIVASYSV